MRMLRRLGRAVPTLLALLLPALGLPAPAGAQVEAEPVLRGRVLVGDEPMDSGTVVLHRITSLDQGELDSIPVGPGGSFSFDLPSVPDEARSEMYFASTRHKGVLYFGNAVTTALQLDSAYLIQAWDTLVVSEPQGLELPVPIRNLFFEEEGDSWRVTDLIQVRNDRARTLVSLDDGVVWRYPLPDHATSPTLGGDFIPGSSEFVDGELVVHSALPPGERVFVVRYLVPDPYVTIPLPGRTEVLEVLIREPAPLVEIPALQRGIPVEMEPGTTYRRFSGSDLDDARIAMVEGDEQGEFPVRWLAVLLALLLTAVALWAVLGRPDPAPGPVPGDEAGQRKALVLEIARMDRDFERLDDATPEDRARYRRERKLLMDRLAGLD